MLTLSAEPDARSFEAAANSARRAQSRSIVVIAASAEELSLHQHVLALIDKASGGNTVWRRP
jgi:hypothetical protein